MTDFCVDYCFGLATEIKLCGAAGETLLKHTFGNQPKYQTRMQCSEGKGIVGLGPLLIKVNSTPI